MREASLSQPGPPAARLYWIPVGAGTPRAQQASLAAWEAVAAFLSRRKRAVLYHSALKLIRGAETLTLEMTPEFVGGRAEPLMGGPVAFRFLGRFRLFRYQLLCQPGETLPDEQFTVGLPISISTEPAIAERILALAPSVPSFTWGRRAPGTSEMWTSDSAVSWLLVNCGIDPAPFGPPPGGRAPGWRAGIEVGREGTLSPAGSRQ